MSDGPEAIKLMVRASLKSYSQCELLTTTNFVVKALRKLAGRDDDMEPFAEDADMESTWKIDEGGMRKAEALARKYPRVWDFIDFVAPTVRKGVFGIGV